jgi:hypothetical protein
MQVKSSLTKTFIWLAKNWKVKDLQAGAWGLPQGTFEAPRETISLEYSTDDDAG